MFRSAEANAKSVEMSRAHFDALWDVLGSRWLAKRHPHHQLEHQGLSHLLAVLGGYGGLRRWSSRKPWLFGIEWQLKTKERR